MKQKNLENRLRRRLKKQGYYLQKSRKRNQLTINDWGGYRIVDSYGWIIAGEHFDLFLDEVQRFAEE